MDTQTQAYQAPEFLATYRIAEMFSGASGFASGGDSCPPILHQIGKC